MTEDKKRQRFERLLEPISTIIFDFDGVLADSEKYHYLSYSEVFRRYGHEIDETEYYKYWTSLGQGARGEIDRHSLHLDPVAIRDEKRPIFTRYCEDGSIKLFPEALELLDLLQPSGLELTIASGSTTSDIEAILRNGGVRNRFSRIIGSDVIPSIKPAPDIFLKMLEVTGRRNSECLIIEDAEKGLQAAMKARIPVIVILTEETRRFDFGDADLVLASHAEMIEIARDIFGDLS